LERIRKQAIAGAEARPSQIPASSNGRGEILRNIELTLTRADFKRARRFSVSLLVEDADNHVVDAIRNLQVDLQDVAALEKILLHLKIALNAKE